MNKFNVGDNVYITGVDVFTSAEMLPLVGTQGKIQDVDKVNYDGSDNYEYEYLVCVCIGDPDKEETLWYKEKSLSFELPEYDDD